MRYALLSDIHANAVSFRAVLQDAVDNGCEKIICLGDVLGYGPDVVSTLDLAYHRLHVCLAGNHDDAICARYPILNFTEFAAKAVARQRKLLSAEALDWLHHLPYTCDFSNAQNTSSFACAHGDFASPQSFNYVLEACDARASFRVRKEPLLFAGHTHHPLLITCDKQGNLEEKEPTDFTLEPSLRYFVNVGSVGYPRSGACRSTYCIYDDEARHVTFRFLPFDLADYHARMKGQGLEEAPWMIRRAREQKVSLVRGKANLGNSPSSSPHKKTHALKQIQITPPKAHPIKPIRAAPLPQASPSKPSYIPLFIVLALIFSLAGIWCTWRLTQSLEKQPPTRLEIVRLAEPVAPTNSSAFNPLPSPTTHATFLVTNASCTVSAHSHKVYFAVRLKKGSAPVWLHIRYENATGERVGEDVWYAHVRSSKRAPKRGLRAPEGATAAFLEVLKSHADDVCTVDLIEFDPVSEKKK